MQYVKRADTQWPWLLSKRVAGSAKWAKDVRERDKTCTFCGSGENLHAHHVLKYEHFEAHRLDLGNGLTVCENCHLKIHSKGGAYGKKRLYK